MILHVKVAVSNIDFGPFQTDLLTRRADSAIAFIGFFFWLFFHRRVVSPRFFWAHSIELKTTSEEKIKWIGGLKNFLWGFEKKVWSRKTSKSRFFEDQNFCEKCFFAKHVDFRVFQKLFYASLSYIMGIENVLLV